MLDFYGSLISLRHNGPTLPTIGSESVTVTYDTDAQWFAMHRGAWSVV